MPRYLFAIAGALLVAACSVFGVRSGLEQPDYTVVAQLGGDVEVRRYAPRLAAEVTVERPDGEDGRNRAFRLLADYIFGNNTANREIAMTAPVEVDTPAQKIDMTAPVETRTPQPGRLTMRFFLPAKLTQETAPKPNNPQVRIVTLPARHEAALRFTGFRGRERVRAMQRDLLNALQDSDWTASAEPAAYFYDPPWSIPFLRRNEVAVAVEARSPHQTR